MFPKHKSQQIISATNGAVIENVTQQIIHAGKPDKDFAIGTARFLPNLVNQAIVIDRINTAISTYVWRPPGIETSLSSARVQGYSVPVWKFKGYVYVTWTHLVTTSRQIGETKYEETHPKEESKQMYFEWLIPAISESSDQAAKILESFVAVNSGKSALRVAWKLPAMGRIVSNFLWLFRRNKNKIDHAATLFDDPMDLPKHIKRDKSSSRSLADLQPNLTLNNALARLKSQLDLHIRNIIGARNTIQHLQQKIQVEKIEEYRLPVWLVQYIHERETRYAAFNGYSAKLMNLALPVSLRAEILAISISLLMWFILSNLIALIFISISNNMFVSIWLLMGYLMSFLLLFGLALFIHLKIPRE